MAALIGAAVARGVPQARPGLDAWPLRAGRRHILPGWRVSQA